MKLKINSFLLMMFLKLTIIVVAFFLGHPVYRPTEIFSMLVFCRYIVVYM